MKKEPVKRLGGLVIVGLALAVTVSACGGGSSGVSAPATATPALVATSPPTATGRPAATVTPTAAPTPTAPANPTPVAIQTPAAGVGNTPSADLLAQGKLIFEKNAGGVGCAFCHGLDGKGKGAAGIDAPANRGKTEEQVRFALADVAMMKFIKLTDQEIAAVVGYLQYLEQQP